MPKGSNGQAAFADLRTRLEFIQMGVAALDGIGAILLPGGHRQIDHATCEQASAVFAFFGKALSGPANEAYNAMEELERHVNAIEQKGN